MRQWAENAEQVNPYEHTGSAKEVAALACCSCDSVKKGNSSPYKNYYVYQYATGMSAAVAIVDRILSEGERAAGDYLAALEMGGSDYPLEILRRVGVDMASPDPIESALSVYDEYLAAFERLQ